MQKILFIAYDFAPPVSAGSIRVYKLAKYLVRAGFEITVLCKGGSKPDEIRKNEKIHKDLKNVEVIGVGDLKEHGGPSNKSAGEPAAASNAPLSPHKRLLHWIFTAIKKALVPDTNRFIWAPFAYRAAKRVVKSTDVGVVVTSSPPHSTQLVGLRLKKRFKNKIHWIADFRDLWSLSPAFEMKLAGYRKRNKHWEKRVLQAADRTVFVSSSMKEYVADSLHLPSSALEKAAVITNGYDEEDFAAVLHANGAIETPRTITLCYIGTVRGPRVKNALSQGIQKFYAANPSAKVAFRFVGSFDPNFCRGFDNMPAGRVEFHASVPHQEAISHMVNATALVVILTNDREGEIAFTGKFFEYLRARRPILALVPEGEISNVVLQNGIGEVANPDSPEEIALAIERLVDRIRQGLSLPEDAGYYEKFSRSSIASEFAALMP